VFIGALDIVLSGAKTAAKIFSASSALYRKLGKVLEQAYNVAKQAGELGQLKKIYPLLAVYVAVSLEGEDVRHFFEAMFEETGSMPAIIEYIYDLMSETEDLADSSFPGIDTAHASTTAGAQRIASLIVKVQQRLAVAGIKDADEAGRIYGKAITVIDRFGGRKALNLPADDIAGEALVIAGKYGPADAMEALLSGKLPVSLRNELMGTIQRIDWAKLADDIGEAGIDALSSKTGPFAYLGQSKGNAKAAKMMLEQIELAQKSGNKILALEQRVVIKSFSGAKIASSGQGLVRFTDLVMKMTQNGKTFFVELKAWDEVIEFTTKSGQKVTIGAPRWFEQLLNSKSSQVYKDVILYSLKQEDLGLEAFQGVKWLINAKGAVAIRKAVNAKYGTTFAAGEEVQALTFRLLKGVKENKAWLADHLGRADDWDDFMVDLIASLNRRGDEFFQIVE
jgi:hypothetical protein